MLLEWVRRHDAAFARHMGAQLFNPGAIRETKAIEGDAAGANSAAANGSPAASGDGSLGIGSLREAR